MNGVCSKVKVCSQARISSSHALTSDCWAEDMARMMDVTVSLT